MAQPQQQVQPQPGSQSPLAWLSEMMPDLAGDDTWLLPHQDLAADPLANAASPRAGEAAAGRDARKRQLPGGDAADSWDSECDDDGDAGCCGRRGGPRKKGAAAKEQKKINEKARRQRENEFIAQLAQLLDPARAGRADKLSTLADAVKEITRLRADTASLQRLNKILEERVADLKARQQFGGGMLPPPDVFMQQFQQLQAHAQQAAQQAQQAQQQQIKQEQPAPVPQQQQAPVPKIQTQPLLQAVPQEQALPQAQTQLPVQQQTLQPQHLQPTLPGMGGMVAVPAAALQQMLAAHQARCMDMASKAAAATAGQPGSAFAGLALPPQAFKAPGGGGDVLSSAACLYMPSAELDVSADGVKRPPAA